MTILLLFVASLASIHANLPYCTGTPPTNPRMAVLPYLMVFDKYTPWIFPEYSDFGVDLYIENLDSGWALQNASFSLSYDSPDPVILLLNITVDSEWAGPNTIDTSTAGTLNAFVQGHASPEGDIPVASVFFRIVYQGTCPPLPLDASNYTELIFSSVTMWGETEAITTDPPQNGFIEIQPYLGSWYFVRMCEAATGKAVVCEGFNINITATIESNSLYEQDVNVTFYANNTIVKTENITLLGEQIRYNVTLNYVWNTSGFIIGKYNVTASVYPYSGDRWWFDNEVFAGWITVSIVGDVIGPDGPPDGKVDIRDIAAIAARFGLTNPSQHGCAYLDINNDNKIDITDVALAALHFGEVNF